MFIASYVGRDGRARPALRRGYRVLAQRGTSSGRRRISPHAHDDKQRVGGNEAVERQIAGMKDLQQGEEIAESVVIETQQVLQVGLEAGPVP